MTINAPQVDHLATIVKALETDGYYVARDFVSHDQILMFRQACETMLDTVPWFSSKRYTHGHTPDYAIKWLFSEDKKHLASIRLMLFEHNEQDLAVRAVIDSVSNLKKQLDSHWPETIAFYKEQQMDSMCIVSRYENETGYYPRHRDAPLHVATPLPQAQMLLSEPDRDFRNGDLVLHPKNGDAFTSKDLNLKMGDLFIFDKRIEHSVVQVNAGETDIGRWMALFGVSVKPIAAN